MYKKVEEAGILDCDQLVICKCPEWNDEGFQIATWSGKEFEYSGQPNDMFNELVVAFLPIDGNGLPYPELYYAVN